MAEEEDDYMSTSFVAAAHPQVKDARPRKPPAVRKGPEKPKSFKEREAESLKQGLSSAIASDNKGFKMLKMMGYKEGTGLGKDASGNVEAIPLNIKRSRSGLGEEEERKRKINKMAAKRVKFDDNMLVSFKGRMKDKYGMRKVEGQLKSIIGVCKHMDETKGIVDNDLIPKEPAEGEEKEEEEEEKRADKILENFLILNEYLLVNYFYCFFCGTRYDDEEDLKNNCPGPLGDDHD